MAADKETVEKFLFWLYGDHGQHPDLPTIQKKIADDGIDIHGKFKWNESIQKTPYGDNPFEVEGSLLHRAIALRHTSLVRWLIDEKLDVNAPLWVRYGKSDSALATALKAGWRRTPLYTPLALAAHQLNIAYDVPEIVEMLLAAGADPNLAVDKDKKNTALDVCVRSFNNDRSWPGTPTSNDAERSKKTLESLLNAGADPAPAVMDDLLGELKLREKAYEDAVRKKEREEAKRPLHSTEDYSLIHAPETRKKWLEALKEGLHELLKYQIAQLVPRQQEGRRLFAHGDEAIDKLAQHCLAAEAPPMAALLTEGSKAAPDFSAVVEHCFNAGMADIAVSLFTPDKWPDKPDLLHAYDETLSQTLGVSAQPHRHDAHPPRAYRASWIKLAGALQRRASGTTPNDGAAAMNMVCRFIHER